MEWTDLPPRKATAGDRGAKALANAVDKRRTLQQESSFIV